MSPTTRLEPKGPGVDLLSWRTWRWLIFVLAAAIWAARMYRLAITPATFVLLIRYAAGLGDAWEGAQRQRAGLKATLLAFLGLGMWWPAPWPHWWLIGWIATPLILAIYATRIIGSSGSDERVQAKIGVGFSAAAKHLPPDTRQQGKAEITDNGTKRVKFRVPSGSPKWDPKTAALNIAQDADLSAPQVQINALHHDQAGLHELVVRSGKPFQFDDPDYPAPGTWPKGKLPLAWNGDRDTVWLNMAGTNGKHIVIAGRTGSGKTNTQRVILAGMVQLRIALRLIDPHGEFEDYAPFAGDHYATSAQAGAQLLAALVAEMRARLADKTLSRDPICCMVDEAPAVLAVKGAEVNANALAMEGRKVGIILVFAVQYPTVELFGGPLRQQMSTVIVHRVKDVTGSNVALGQGAAGAGWDASNKQTMKRQGRAIAELEGADEARQFIQVFPAPAAPLQAEVIETHLAPRPAGLPAPTLPPADAWPAVRPSVRPPSGGTEQGEQAADGRTDGHDLKGLEARILPVLNGHPLSGRQVAEEIGASPDGVNKALKRLEVKGLAVQNGGWLRA